MTLCILYIVYFKILKENVNKKVILELGYVEDTVLTVDELLCVLGF
jgi:hypothetical protein